MPQDSTISPHLPQLTLSGPGGELPLDRSTIEVLAELFVSLLNLAEPDAELEHDGTDQGDQAWIEWDKMRGNQKPHANFTLGDEGAEEDDPAEEDDGGGDVVTEDEPAFDPLSRAIANVMGADGPGGGSLLDSDCSVDGD